MTPNPISLSTGSPRFPQESALGASTLDQWQALLSSNGAKQAAQQVHGDFAVALQLADGSVFMAVDRFAIRSLCYRIDEDKLHCAERADDLSGRVLDPQGIFDYLYFHVIPSPRTVFQCVQRLPPGHYAVFKDGKLTVAPYWIPHFKPAASASLDQLKVRFRHLLKSAVERQMDGSTPACFLSGGTDSSTVAGMMSSLTDRRVTAYSIGFEAEGYDEMAFARIAAKHFGCAHHEYYVTPDDLVRNIPKVAAYYDQPFGNSSALPSYLCALRAREEGVTRILAGDGGDELFGGNSRYATQKVFEVYQRLPAVIRRHLLEPVFRQGFVNHLPVLKRGPGYIRHANTPQPDRSQVFNLLRRLGFDEVLAPALRRQLDTDSVLVQQRQVWAAAECKDEINRHLAYDWRYTLAECDLPKVCATTKLAGLSVGFPMLDEDLLDFSMHLPLNYKVKGMKLRWFFKEALRGFLPDEILVKKKQGFGLPFGVWTVRHDGLRQLAHDAIGSLTDRGLLNSSFSTQLLQRHLPEAPHYYGTMVWILIMLEHWLRHHSPDYRLQA